MKPTPNSDSGTPEVLPAQDPLPQGQARLLTMLRLDLAAILREYFPHHIARQLSGECEQLARKYVETVCPIRKIALSPGAYVRNRKKSR